MRLFRPDRDFHEDFVAGMIPPSVIGMVDEPWPELLSEDLDEHHRLLNQRIKRDQDAYYRQVVEDCNKEFPPWWVNLLGWWQRVLKRVKNVWNNKSR